MDQFIIILICIVLLILVTLITLIGILIYSGLFESVVVGTDEPPIGEVTIVYKFARGPYNEAGNLFTEINSLLPNKQFDMIGIYYDNPDNVEAKDLRYIAGVIVSKDDEEYDVPLVETLLQKKCLIATLPKVDHSVVCNFPYKTFISIYFAIWKLYPEMKQYCKEKNLCAHPCIEVYTSNQIRLFAPLSRQHDFYVKPYTSCTISKNLSKIEE